MIGFIDANHGDGKPFFAYVAHQAPHDPYHLPKEWRNRHVGEYDKGWDAVRQERLKRQIELGIMPAGTQLAERMYFLPDPVVLAPASRAILGRKMELYAGMVENLDHHVGRLIDHLKKIGEYDNTIFIVFGDNGAEGTDLFKMIAGTPGTLNYLFAASRWSQTNPNAWGDPGSYVGYGPMWAQVSMTPFSQYKGWVAEGGIRNALIVSGPVVQRPKGSINHGLMHVADIMPTLLSIAGASYPKTSSDGKELPALMGKPWNDMLAGRAESPRTERDYLAWEIFGNRAVRQGEWKLRWQFKPYGTGEWELYNVATDPGERMNVAAQNPDKVQGAAGGLGRLCQGQQRDPAEPRAVRDPVRPAAGAGPGRRGLPAAHLPAAVRAAEGHAGGTQAVNGDRSANQPGKKDDQFHEHRTGLDESAGRLARHRVDVAGRGHLLPVDRPCRRCLRASTGRPCPARVRCR